MKSLTSSKLFFSDIVYQFLQVLTLSRKSFCLLPVMGLVSKAASCIPCNGGMKEEWFTSHDGQKEDDLNLMTNREKDKLTSSKNMCFERVKSNGKIHKGGGAGPEPD